MSRAPRAERRTIDEPSVPSTRLVDDTSAEPGSEERCVADAGEGASCLFTVGNTEAAAASSR